MEIKGEHNQQHMLLQTKYGIWHTFILKSSIDFRVTCTHKVNLALFILLYFSTVKNLIQEST